MVAGELPWERRGGSYERLNIQRILILSCIAATISSAGCLAQPGPGEPCDGETFVPYCCSDIRLCECVDSNVDDFSCDQFCINIGYDDGGQCDVDQTLESKLDDHFYTCHCDGIYK